MEGRMSIYKNAIIRTTKLEDTLAILNTQREVVG
jgi:hypothetical protein